MTFPITDHDHDWKMTGASGGGLTATNGTKHSDSVTSYSCSCGATKTVREEILTPADRRQGPADRRKVRDVEKARQEVRRGDANPSKGRRHDDKYFWPDLPLSHPPIPVSEGMIQAGGKVMEENASWEANRFLHINLDNVPGMAQRIYRAMEAKRIEEQKGVVQTDALGKAPYGAEVHFRYGPNGVCSEPGVLNERSGRDRRKGGQ